MDEYQQAMRAAFLAQYGYQAEDLYDEFHSSTKSEYNPRCFACFLRNNSRAHGGHDYPRYGRAYQPSGWEVRHPHWCDHYATVYHSQTRTYSAFIGQPYGISKDEYHEIERAADKYHLGLSITKHGSWHNDGCMLIVLYREHRKESRV